MLVRSSIEQEIENVRKIMATVGMRIAYRIDDEIQVKISKKARSSYNICSQAKIKMLQ